MVVGAHGQLQAPSPQAPAVHPTQLHHLSFKLAHLNQKLNI
jgi:hypothetical protein